ncbi:hypothetical protein EEB11_10280 [Pseudotabrizicola sediminis]|uniref:Uncharacterized protein n=1 Tax=Pseudotabrizicola sediminis TaxID=2486418 RepID=A0ABY2KP62_9RHOB|nr:hypothetical protein EEB11_10280 [Pseudotabrizicola sediminis]
MAKCQWLPEDEFAAARAPAAATSPPIAAIVPSPPRAPPIPTSPAAPPIPAPPTPAPAAAAPDPPVPAPAPTPAPWVDTCSVFARRTIIASPSLAISAAEAMVAVAANARAVVNAVKRDIVTLHFELIGLESTIVQAAARPKTFIVKITA